MNQSVFLIGTDYDGVTHSDWVLLDSNVNATQITSGFGGYIVYAQVGSSPEEEENVCAQNSYLAAVLTAVILGIAIGLETVSIFLLQKRIRKLESEL